MDFNEKVVYIDKYFPKILKIISNEKYLTSTKIADILKISEKTARVKLNQLSEILKESGASIVSKKGMGYTLKIEEKEKYNAFFNELTNKVFDYNVELLIMLLWKNDYIKIEEIIDLMYISRNMVSKELKSIETILKSYSIKLDRRPNYGINILGEEFRKRMLILDINKKKRDYKINIHLYIVCDFLLQVLDNNNIFISNTCFENIALYIAISIERIKYNFYINDLENISKDIDNVIKKVCFELSNEIEKNFNIEFNDTEIFFLALYLNTQLSSSTHKMVKLNLDLEKTLEKILDEMFEVVLNAFQVDYNKNKEIRALFMQHIVPLHNRLSYNIKIKNPLLDTIKTEYTDCHMIANYACSVLKKYYKKEIPEDEIGYFTMLFACAKEMKEKVIDKKNILIINTSGKSLSKLFLYKYKSSFEEYIDNIYEYNIREIGDFDFEKVDYIFITSKVHIDFPKPVFDINILLESQDILKIEKLLKNDDQLMINKYYKKHLFINNIKETEKEKVLKVLFNNCKKYYDIDDRFYKSVLKREELATTDFLEDIAVFHPHKSIFEYSFVSVGILDKPIWWGRKNVSIVFLLSIAIGDNEYLENFYDITSGLMLNNEKIDILKKNPSFETLYLLLTS